MLHTDFPYAREIYETVIETAINWVVIVDQQGFVLYINESYSRFLGIDRLAAAGKHVTAVIENTRMHIVVQTGQEEIAALQYIKGNYMIANRIPVRADGKIVGAIGTVMFRDPNEWNEMNTHVRQHLTSLQPHRNRLEDTGAKYTLDDIKSASKTMLLLKEKVKSVAAADSAVLIRGESGTGKELFAHSIHLLSDRNKEPFIKVNCGAIPEHLLESELFGYEEGAFTGAKRGGKKGKFLLADKGTIFLDEIGDMSLHMQVKLLRVLQEKEIEPVGGVKTLPLNVRVIAATNKPLEQMIHNGSFREDLYYRISVIPIHVPPLRERMEDLAPLVAHFIKKISLRTGKRISSIHEEVMEIFMQYKWQGNIRELENVIEASIHLSKGEEITSQAVPDYIKQIGVFQQHSGKLKDVLAETEKRTILEAVRRHGGDKKRAAAALGISKSTLYEKIQKYIEPVQSEKPE
ncbi:PAS domain-containing protein [Bacillus lacus]|uniref:PAS domain-containing protein n=1 Tax=Metabacillus lacus TaxID=1983721 RepID=A0A7X2LZY7_9BACI|nr:sigma 54-interacting transcriptional regulator [Metabacillus lacus]MRX73956.1 PAS domain-containing protein [Metabacillus lacus]